MRYLYQEEFLKQKLPTMEEYNKRFGPRYRGIDYILEEGRRYYHMLDRAQPLVQEEPDYEYEENDDDYYYNEPSPPSPSYDIEAEIRENKRREKKARRKRLMKKRLKLLKFIIEKNLNK